MDSDGPSSIDWYLQVKETGDTKTQREGCVRTETMSEVSGKARIATATATSPSRPFRRNPQTP